MKLKVFIETDGFQVWLDEGDFEHKTGFCIGGGSTRKEALDKAKAFLTGAASKIDEIAEPGL
jgi:hypothetical protein